MTMVQEQNIRKILDTVKDLPGNEAVMTLCHCAFTALTEISIIKGYTETDKIKEVLNEFFDMYIESQPNSHKH